MLIVLASGCATRDWVRQHVGQREAEIDQKVGQRVAEVDQRVVAESQRLTKVEGQVGETVTRLGGVEGSIKEVGEAARDARARAEAAQTKAEEVDGRLTRLWSNRHKRNLVDSVDVLFGFNRWDLSDGAQTALLQVIKELKENPNLTVELEGYADPRGPRDYNIALSQRRVEAVRRYLIQKGAEMPRIHQVGLGPLDVAKSAEEYAKARRVTVKLMVAAE
ncbi:MAG TPA: OmpA family protein [Candidatus Tectomicrobia bacterium]|nr:OmpA family protein [Candidatus Tectomicrobia bacterium]